MKTTQKVFNLEDLKRNKKIKQGRADFHKLGQLLKIQLIEEKRRKDPYNKIN